MFWPTDKLRFLSSSGRAVRRRLQLGRKRRADDIVQRKEAKSAEAELFTIPQEQMSHVQVVTVEPTKLARVLRLTGAVAYNAFNTTPVITQVGGPVSRILVVPGERVKLGQPLLT